MNKRRYRITATIHKPGGAPVSWTYYSAHRMTSVQCEKMLSKNKEAGRHNGFQVTLTDFSCEKVENNEEVIQVSVLRGPVDVTHGTASQNMAGQ